MELEYFYYFAFRKFKKKIREYIPRIEALAFDYRDLFLGLFINKTNFHLSRKIFVETNILFPVFSSGSASSILSEFDWAEAEKVHQFFINTMGLAVSPRPNTSNGEMIAASPQYLVI